jgi:hypothetical protein
MRARAEMLGDGMRAECGLRAGASVEARVPLVRRQS